VPLYSGMGYRLVTWAIGTAVIIAFVMRYAARVKANPEISPVRDIDLARESHQPGGTDAGAGWNARHAVTLSLFASSMALLVIGVLAWGWFIEEIAALFLGIGLVVGLAGGMGPSRIAKTFVTGARDMVGVVFIIACARALLVIAQDARIGDSILYGASRALSLLPRGAIAQLMFLIQCVINFFIHSGTAQAALTMPIMAPLADLVGITRQTAVYAFQLCEFINPILPTSAVTMGVLGAARIPWERWARWFLPLMLILVALSCLLLVPPVLLFEWN